MQRKILVGFVLLFVIGAIFKMSHNEDKSPEKINNWHLD